MSRALDIEGAYLIPVPVILFKGSVYLLEKEVVEIFGIRGAIPASTSQRLSWPRHCNGWRRRRGGGSQDRAQVVLERRDNRPGLISIKGKSLVWAKNFEGVDGRILYHSMVRVLLQSLLNLRGREA